MGESFVSISEDAYSSWWNPAGLASVEGPELAAAYNDSMEDVANQYLSVAYPLRYGATLGLSVIGPCSPESVFEGSFKINGASISAGKVSEDVFTAAGVPYTWDGDGFLSIMGSPSGAAAVEVVSGSEMRVYGWCYAVNGSTPSVMPGAFLLNDNSARLVWFYAYSTYKDGVWGDSCLPSYEVKPHQFCAASGGFPRTGAPLSGNIPPARRPEAVLRGQNMAGWV